MTDDEHIRISLTRLDLRDRSRAVAGAPADVACPSVVEVARLREGFAGGCAGADAVTFEIPAPVLIAELLAIPLGAAAIFGAGPGAGMGLVLPGLCVLEPFWVFCIPVVLCRLAVWMGFALLCRPWLLSWTLEGNP